jgi:hypothetical protein
MNVSELNNNNTGNILVPFIAVNRLAYSPERRSPKQAIFQDRSHEDYKKCMMEATDKNKRTYQKTGETIDVNDDLQSDGKAIGEAERASTPAESIQARIPDQLLSTVLSFCDPSEHVSFLEASKAFFSNALQLHLLSTPSLSLSFLLRRFPNGTSDHSRQENAVATLLNPLLMRSVSQASRRFKLKHIELSNLRAVTGGSFLLSLKDVPLVGLDVTNCIRLDPHLLLQFLRGCSKTLRYLNLTGCTQVGSNVVETIMERHTQLATLSLASCSQSLRADSILPNLRRFRHLQHLDISGLKHVSDESMSLIDWLPDSLQSIDLGGCEQLRMVSAEAQQKMQVYLVRSQAYVEAAEARIANINNILDDEDNNNNDNREIIAARAAFRPGILRDNPEVYFWNDEPTSRHRLRHLVLDGIASPRRGLCRGIVAYFAHGRCLREVHLSGCEQVGDWEIAALAVTCGDTLTSFQMRAGRIGNAALKALARYCNVLVDIDVSACFHVGDSGIAALCGPRDIKQRRSDAESQSPDRKRRRLVRNSLTALKIASLPHLTDRGAGEISNLSSLLVLDIHDCPQVSASTLQRTLHCLPHLIEVNARDIGNGAGPPLTTRLKNDELTPPNLKFLNQRAFSSSVRRGPETASLSSLSSSSPSSSSSSSGCMPKDCCIVQSQSQRLGTTVPLRSMYHCLNCQLIPSLGRGVCENCVTKCHKGHKTFLGSYTRFYCDCPFILNAENDFCQAITLPPRNVVTN